MASPLVDEIRGDWSNLKGTEYHLAYALWLLVCRNVENVAFYRGNDLLANLVPPLAPEEIDSMVPAIHTQMMGEDEWIQLKATREPWTRSALLANNLLENFMYNALVSEGSGRTWRARLITQGDIQRQEIEEFVRTPDNFQRLAENLQTIVDAVQNRLQADMGSTVDTVGLRALALTILQQLAQEIPVSLAQLKAEIDLQLAYRYLDPEAVRQAGNKLLGALLRDAAVGPAAAHVYNEDWVDQVAGTPLKPRLPFDINPISACDLAVRAIQNLPGIQWQLQRFALRTRLENALQHFLHVSETVFVLLGMSGTGKSWAVADWTGRVLHMHLRLLVPGSDLDHEDQRTLSHLVALRLRSFTSAPITDEDMLAKLRAVARIEGNGQPVIVVDDVVPTGDISVFRRDLARLVGQCRDANVKLVLVCQLHTWDFYRLGQDIPPADIYLPDPESGWAESGNARVLEKPAQERDRAQRQMVPSFILPDFTPEEQVQMLSQRLPNNIATRVSRLLHAPGFTPLRRPYMLERYLEQYSDQLQQPGSNLVPVDVDVLLDRHLEMLLSRAASLINADDDDVLAAFDVLQRRLWATRPNGLTNAQAEDALEPHLHTRSGEVLNAFRRVGLMAAKGRVRFADPPLAERVFARTLRARYLAGDNMLDEIRLEDDAGVVSALLRSLSHVDPVSLAETLLQRDPQWIGPIAEGLAQCSPQDYRVLAFLTVLTRLNEGILRFEGCDALGRLAAYGHRRERRGRCERRAFEWVTQLYLSSRRTDRHRGSRALGVTLDLAPERVEHAMRIRFALATRMDISSSTNREQREAWLHGALVPLLSINHPAAAEVGERILTRYTFLGGHGTQKPDEQFLREVDEARGCIAIFKSDEMARLLADLRNPEAGLRGHAASALRSVMFEQPERIQEVICEAIRCETDWYVMNQLLFATFRLTELAPDALLDALVGTFALDWSSPSSSTGQALAALSNLAQHCPERVASLLPEQLDAYPAWSRGWLSEGLAYAWWTCAEKIPQARDVLARLAIPDLVDVPDECQMLALRGAAIAKLALLSLGAASAKELQGRQVSYPETRMQFLFVLTSEFANEHATELMAQQGVGELLDLVVSCLLEERRVTIHPFNKPLFRAQGVCTSLCLDMLISLASVYADPIALIRRLPSGWRIVYSVRRLLEAGRTEPAVTSFARELCDAPTSGRDTQELGERQRLLVQLAGLTQTPTDVLQELRTAMPVSPFTADDHASALAELFDEHIEDMLDLLARNLECEDDLVSLHRWVERARSWQGLLIAKVYARAFEPRPIRLLEARELCEQMLAAVRGLPTSTIQQEYLAVYGSVADRLDGMATPIPMLRPSGTMQNAIERSHTFALELLHHSSAKLTSEQITYDELVDLLAAARGKGWWNKARWRLDGDSIGFGSSSDVVYVFPAVRLAFVATEAAENVSHPGDPAARFLKERNEVTKLLAEHMWELDPTSNTPKDSLEDVLTLLENLGATANRDERVRSHRGLLLLRLDRLHEAELELQQCLEMPSCVGETRATVLYNLGCVYARTGRVDLCMAALREAIALWPLFRQSLETDPDFITVREMPWFQELHKQAT